MSTPPVLVWFRRDLRLDDNPALRQALRSGHPLLPVFILPAEEDGGRSGPAPEAPGGASRWWLHHALADLSRQLEARGSLLLLRRGDPMRVLPALAAEAGSRALFCNRCFEPVEDARDAALKDRLETAGVSMEQSNSHLLFGPQAVTNQSGGAFKVFTPFHRRLLALPKPSPAGAAPEGPWPTPDPFPVGDRLESLGLLPKVPWDAAMGRFWKPTRAGAWARLESFLGSALSQYPEGRHRPDLDGTSRLSPYLHFGQIGPREVLARVLGWESETGGSAATFISELHWREFAYHILHHFPLTPQQPLRPEFRAFPWKLNSGMVRRWRHGQTGYPIVDAGMRQLWETGWMHNRVRMIVASFLVKHLLQPWTEGARWFWDTLVDADLANNTLGWQWVAGCGADAAPYFRIFNPILQGLKFDPDGSYVRQYVPELEELPAPLIHHPWQATPLELLRYGVHLGKSYPRPMVDHAHGRAQALAAFASLSAEPRSPE